jgi:hypothetical protein
MNRPWDVRLVIRICAGPAVPGGVVAVIKELVTTVTLVAGFPPKLTVAPTAKPEPASDSTVPPTLGPLLGVTLAASGMEGHAAAKAFAASASAQQPRVVGFRGSSASAKRPPREPRGNHDRSTEPSAR